MAEPLLEVRDLRVTFDTEDGPVTAVDGVSFSVAEGQVLGIVGESGSGKSVSMMSVMGLVSSRNAHVSGEVLYRGRDLLRVGARELRAVRGSEIAMIFQDPMTSLNPVYRIGWQIEEQIRAHGEVSRRAARARAVDLLRQVGIPDAARRIDDFPHRFSGGQRQRVMIAMALSCSPRLLIADEPTTALDVTIQAQILDLIRTLSAATGSAVVLITHDLGVVANLADRVQVMYDGRIVESGSTSAIFNDPLHPYTWGLLGSIPRVDRPRPRRLTAIPGTPPSPHGRTGGCVFAPRCPYRFEACDVAPPLADRRGAGHLDACHLPIDDRAALRAAAISTRLEAGGG
jgi:peptide/nickel transport system ATP-binding protein